MINIRKRQIRCNNKPISAKGIGVSSIVMTNTKDVGDKEAKYPSLLYYFHMGC